MSHFEKLRERRAKMPRHVRVEFDVPEDLVDPSVTDADLARQAKEDLVLRHFQAQRVSSGAAAEILGLGTK